MPTSEINSYTTPEGTAKAATHEDLRNLVKQMMLGDIMYFATIAERTTVFDGLKISPPKGAISYIITLKRYDAYDGAAWVTLTSVLNPVVIKHKTGDTSKADAAFAADPHLALPYEANTTYVLDGWLPMEGDAGGDFQGRFTFAAAAGTRLDFGISGPALGATVNEASWRPIAQINQTTSPSLAISVGTILSTWMNVTVSGRLVVGGTGGTLTLEWAEVTAGVPATTVKAGAFLRLMKVP